LISAVCTSKISRTGVGQRIFIGQEYDVDTGLSYLNARYLNGKLGKFISQDPSFLDIGKAGFEQRYRRTLQQHLANPQALNSYSYALNNPIIHSDPSGEIVPFLLAAWAIAEVGLTVYDAYSTYQTVSNPNASQAEKAAAGALFIGGLIGPGGGYKTGVDKAGDVIKAVKGAEGVVSSKAVQGVEGAYLRAAQHISVDHPTRYPGMSVDDIAGMARETHDTAVRSMTWIRD
jgi:RHS repeat-associated protein